VIIQPIDRRLFLGLIPGAALLSPAAPLPNRPKVSGTLSLHARRRAKGGEATQQVLYWPVARTAIIICDMWDTHTCGMSAQRVALMAPRMNQVVSAARSLGVMIIHAPSDTMKFYDSIPHGGTTSLQRDIVDGKPSELEYWNGAVVRLGREAQVPTPTHELIYNCLLPQDLRARGKIAFP